MKPLMEDLLDASSVALQGVAGQADGHGHRGRRPAPPHTARCILHTGAELLTARKAASWSPSTRTPRTGVVLAALMATASGCSEPGKIADRILIAGLDGQDFQEPF